MKRLAALVCAVAGTAAGCGGGGGGDELAVEQATLTPGRILLVLVNGSEDSARVEQVILNDAFVDFSADKKAVQPGDDEQITVSYPWIAGEAYDIELLTSTGATVGYEIEAAA
jgi:zinc transporter, ZIP family